MFKKSIPEPNSNYFQKHTIRFPIFINMKKISALFEKMGPFWGLSFFIVTFMFAYCLVIYGFDINIAKGGRKNAIVAMFANSASDEEFYAIDDEYGYLIRAEEEYEEYAVEYFTAYEQGTIPFCFTCGMFQPKRDFLIWRPFKNGDLLYGIEMQWTGDDYEKDEAFPTFNFKTKEFKWIDNINDLGPDVGDEKYRVKRDFITSNYSEISFSSDDDMDCFSAFLSIYVVYILLIVWGAIILLIKRIRKKA